MIFIKHTEGRWRAHQGHLIIEDGETAKGLKIFGYRTSPEEDVANAKRIALCVNFCKKFSDEELKEMDELGKALFQEWKRAKGL